MLNDYYYSRFYAALSIRCFVSSELNLQGVYNCLFFKMKLQCSTLSIERGESNTLSSYSIWLTTNFYYIYCFSAPNTGDNIMFTRDWV